MSWLTKLWKPGPLNKSRFHDEKGNCVDLGGLMYLPRCLASTAWRTITGRRPAVPWLSYRATRTFASFLRPDSSILEFGSGMSTLWFGPRAGKIISLESDAEWYEIVKGELPRRGLSNVDYRLITTPDFADPPDVPDAAFDLVLVDGWLRGQCAVTAVRKVKPGGYIYLDNVDKAAHNPDFASAEQTLLAAAKSKEDIRYFTDFAPNFVVVHQGLLVRV